MKIRILGNSGSGKTTLANKISSELKLDVLHLDSIRFNPNWDLVPYEDMKPKIEEFLLSTDNWVIDGNYEELSYLYKDVDLYIWIDLDVNQSIQNVKNRLREFAGKPLPGLNGCIQREDETFDEFIDWIKQYPSRRDQIKEQIKGNSVIINSMEELSNFNINDVLEK